MTSTEWSTASFDGIPRSVSRLSDIANADAVVGPVQERSGRTAIPLASVAAGYGFGLGVGQGANRTEGGGGGGGRSHTRPVAIVELTESSLQVHPVVDTTRITVASLLLAAWSVYWVMRTIRAFRRR